MWIITLPLSACVAIPLAVVGFFWCACHETPYAAADRLGLRLRLVIKTIVTFFED